MLPEGSQPQEPSPEGAGHPLRSGLDNSLEKSRARMQRASPSPSSAPRFNHSDARSKPSGDKIFSRSRTPSNVAASAMPAFAASTRSVVASDCDLPSSRSSFPSRSLANGSCSDASRYHLSASIVEGSMVSPHSLRIPQERAAALSPCVAIRASCSYLSIFGLLNRVLVDAFSFFSGNYLAMATVNSSCRHSISPELSLERASACRNHLPSQGRNGRFFARCHAAPRATLAKCQAQLRMGRAR